jgi:division protein CdvB (Snf7/Vps24/ESCRT-III family)
MAKQDDVDDLIRQVADEYSLELKTLLPEIAAGPCPASCLTRGISFVSSFSQFSRHSPIGAGKQQVQQPAAAAHASSQRKVGQQAT